ncbi:hypothetical protein NE865_06899 [Phthorimaea operculella]|nr:hypothetical protein NE865_06899 [Phthorimaea operculella]
MSAATATSKGPVYDPGLCRCCGVLRKCRVLNAEYQFKGTEEVYSDMMMDCFGLLLSYLDGKPTERLICSVCVHKLRDAFAFKKQVLQCEEAFKQMKIFYTDEEKDTETSHTLTTPSGIKIEVEAAKNEPHSPTPLPHNENLESDENMDMETNHSADETTEQPNEQAALKSTQNSDTRSLPKKNLIPQPNDKSYPSYISTFISTNLETIIDCSYICPFKWWHNDLICYYCQEAFKDPEHIRTHTEMAHDHPNIFKPPRSLHKTLLKADITRIDCRLCSTKIDNLDDFRKHISVVHKKQYNFDHRDSILPFKLKSNEWKCALCMKEFQNFDALNKHTSEHFSQYMCESCGLGFVSLHRLKMHIQSHDNTGFPCPECGKKYVSDFNRQLHIDTVHKRQGRYRCHKCPTFLLSYAQKMKHYVEVHGEAPLRIPCAECGKVLSSRRKLTDHKKRHHLKDFRFVCQVCGRKFYSGNELRHHMPTHTDERNFKCKMCDKAFARLKTLKQHYKVHTDRR